jgi:hypothetical protein
VSVAGVLIILVLAVVPLVAWPLLSRARRIGLFIEAVIAIYLVLVAAVGFGWIETRARLDVLLSYAPFTTALIWLGRRIERRQLGDGGVGADRRRAAGWALVAGHVGVMVLCCTPLAFTLSSNPFVPGSDEVLPLPADLVLVSDEDRGCGSGVCTRTVTVTGSTGQAAEGVYNQVVEHLRRQHGWRLDTEGYGCRPAGWLVDRTQLCVSVRADAPQNVAINLEGVRAFACCSVASAPGVSRLPLGIRRGGFRRLHLGPVHLPSEQPAHGGEDHRLDRAEQVHPPLPHRVITAGEHKHDDNQRREPDKQPAIAAGPHARVARLRLLRHALTLSGRVFQFSRPAAELAEHQAARRHGWSRRPSPAR